MSHRGKFPRRKCRALVGAFKITPFCSQRMRRLKWLAGHLLRGKVTSQENESETDRLRKLAWLAGEDRERASPSTGLGKRRGRDIGFAYLALWSGVFRGDRRFTTQSPTYESCQSQSWMRGGAKILSAVYAGATGTAPLFHRNKIDLIPGAVVIPVCVPGRPRCVSVSICIFLF